MVDKTSTKELCTNQIQFRHQVRTETSKNILTRIIHLEAHLTDAESDSDTDFPLLSPVYNQTRSLDAASTVHLQDPSSNPLQNYLHHPTNSITTSKFHAKKVVAAYSTTYLSYRTTYKQTTPEAHL